MIDMASCLEVSNFIELERQLTTASVIASNFSLVVYVGDITSMRFHNQ